MWMCAAACHWQKLPLASHWLATRGICCHMQNLLPLAEIARTCKKTVKVPFPPPTLTGKTQLITPWQNILFLLPPPQRLLLSSTTMDEENISRNEDSLENNSQEKASDDYKRTEDTLFCMARDIQNRTFCHVGTAGMEDCHFSELIGVNHPAI
jgi:hypothetical protein